VINFELQDLASGKRYLIGGDNAILEDISAEKIVIELA
jgi:Archaeal transcriptional regulator TrmB.